MVSEVSSAFALQSAGKKQVLFLEISRTMNEDTFAMWSFAER
jgi:hypothetical protein